MPSPVVHAVSFGPSLHLLQFSGNRLFETRDMGVDLCSGFFIDLQPRTVRRPLAVLHDVVQCNQLGQRLGRLADDLHQRASGRDHAGDEVGGQLIGGLRRGFGIRRGTA